MIIATLEGQADTKPYLCSVVKKYQVVTNAQCYELKTKDILSENGVKNWKHWYTEVPMIGRHFLVYSKKHMEVKRQYTICNSVVPEVYDELLRICEEKLSKQTEITANVKIIDSRNRDSIHLTSKDYKTQKGVAS